VKSSQPDAAKDVKSARQAAANLASSRSLFGAGKRALRSVRLDAGPLPSGGYPQTLRVGSPTAKDGGPGSGDLMTSKYAAGPQSPQASSAAEGSKKP